MPLNPRGRVQAEEAGRRLSGLCPDLGILDFVASPLGRTRRTMEILRTALGLPPGDYRADPGFLELTFGDWEGLTWREVRGRNAAAARQRERDKWGFVPPGGESYGMLRDRLRPAIAGLRRPTVLVSHGGVARAMLAMLAGIPETEAPRIDIWQGRVLVMAGGNHHWV